MNILSLCVRVFFGVAQKEARRDSCRLCALSSGEIFGVSCGVVRRCSPSVACRVRILCVFGGCFVLHHGCLHICAVPITRRNHGQVQNHRRTTKPDQCGKYSTFPSSRNTHHNVKSPFLHCTHCPHCREEGCSWWVWCVGCCIIVRPPPTSSYVVNVLRIPMLSPIARRCVVVSCHAQSVHCYDLRVSVCVCINKFGVGVFNIFL